MNLLALDIGGTAVKYGLFGKDTIFGEFLVKDRDETERLPEKIMEFILEHPTECIGISAPGPFDFETGTGLMEHKLKSLYKISLRDMIKQKFPHVKIFFIHDSTAFILGAICDDSTFSTENIAGVMLGTGLGYVHFSEGKVEVNKNKTPLKPLWNKPYKGEVAEKYVSATAIINKAQANGYFFHNVKEIADVARQGNQQLLHIFAETGSQLGELMGIKKKEDNFDRIIIGGQVSKAWDLMKEGFDANCYVPYTVVENPEICPLLGIKYCSERNVESVYREGER